MDQYLTPNASYLRLLDDYNKHKTLVVAYDFDNTVFDFHDKGHTYHDMVALLRRCDDYNFFLICYTAK